MAGSQLCGNVRIATSTVPSEWLLPELLGEFRRRWPQVRESLSVSDTSLVTAAVTAGEADLGFVRELPRESQLDARAVAEDELALFVAADHPWVRQGTTTIQQLRREPIIVRERGSASRVCVERELNAHHCSPAELTVAMEANSNDAIRAAVRRGVGVASLSRRGNRNQTGLAPVLVRGIRPRRQLYLISDPSRIPPPAARQFLEFVEHWRSSTGR